MYIRPEGRVLDCEANAERRGFKAVQGGIRLIDLPQRQPRSRFEEAPNR